MIRLTAFLTTLAILCASATAQVLDDYDLGGASKPRPDLSFRKDNQYKRVHQSSLRFILRGDIDRTEAFLTQFLADHPKDEERLYMLGIVAAQRGQTEKAERRLSQAINAGLPPGRILAGPRPMLDSVTDSALFAAWKTHFETRPIHGPLLGNLTATASSFWVRTSDEFDIQVLVSADRHFNRSLRSRIVRSKAEDDYTAVATVKGLQPETTYFYAVSINRGPFHFAENQTFKTPVKPGSPTTFTLAFGGGAGFVPENERMWTTIESTRPDAMLLLGDNVYIDDPESVVMQQYTYQRRQSRPEWRQLTAHVPVYTIWDDHDFSTNDSWGGPDIAVPFWKRDWVYPIFRQNWVNPAYGGGMEQPGCWYTFQIGDVDFIMLDCRYYRTSPRQSPRSMLGGVQKRWLKQQLLAAKGTFKVLCSSVPWDFRTKGDSLDTWNGYKEEHEEILSFVDDNDIEGVVLMSADRHRSDAWKLDRPDGYGLYEFNSSRLTNQHVHPTMEKKGAIFSYNALQSFGLVHFDTTTDDPHVTYEVVNIDGEKPHSLTVHRSELKK